MGGFFKSIRNFLIGAAVSNGHDEVTLACRQATSAVAGELTAGLKLRGATFER
jgi:hypothetical protein